MRRRRRLHLAFRARDAARCRTEPVGHLPGVPQKAQQLLIGRKKMRVLIADDHPLMLAALRQALEADGGFEVVAEAASGEKVLPLVGRTTPDVVLLDLRMPGMDGLACLDRIVARHPQTKVVMMSSITDPERIQATFKHGACGYIVKTIDAADLPSAIRQAVDGTAYHALGLPALNEESAANAAGLTDRELTIIKAVARGLSNQAIGRELWVTEQTVKFHLTNVYRKLAVANRTEAARWAFAHGLVNQENDQPTMQPAAAV
jgi:NarL family two-component system response regulator LiaR